MRQLSLPCHEVSEWERLLGTEDVVEKRGKLMRMSVGLHSLDQSVRSTSWIEIQLVR